MWAAAKVCQISFRPVLKSGVPALRTTLKANTLEATNYGAKFQTYRQFTRGKPHILRRAEAAKRDPEVAFTIGRGAVAGAGVAGVAALCFYGLGLSSKEGIIENAMFWPEYVRDRVRTTFMYVGGSIAISAISAVAVLRSPALMNVFANGGIVPTLLMTGALIGAGMITRSIPYEPGIGTKQLAWMGFSSLVGAMMAPLAIFGGPILMRAALNTAGIVGSLSVVAMCAPNDQFLKMGGVLAIGSGLVFASGIGAMFLAPTTMVGASLHSIFLYGGLILFSGLLLYDTQQIAKRAEGPPDRYCPVKYDPINMSMSVFMDIANIFMRMVVIMSGSKRKN